MSRKNLKVSEIVHEELEVRKHRDESFDDVLKRELGIIPSTVDELTTYYPEKLQTAISRFTRNLDSGEQYHRLVTDHENYFALNYDSKESGRTILQLRFYSEPTSVEVFYRNDRGELESAAEVFQQEGEENVIADMSFTHPDTGDLIQETTHFHQIEDILGTGIQSLQTAAYERWG